jgi:ESF2/ABP1 family protein
LQQFFGYMESTQKSPFDGGFSDSSDNEQGYDLEAEELSRGATLVRSAKKRKLSHSSDEEPAEDDEIGNSRDSELDADALNHRVRDGDIAEEQTRTSPNLPTKDDASAARSSTVRPTSQTNPRRRGKEKKPGVIYLSSLPSYLRPSALRNLLTQRGFAPIKRLFLTPASKASSHHSKKNSRQLYTEGWIEFESKKVARRCAETLNATAVGGKKGGFYRDDLWNMKYLRGMGWDELMAGVREERREEEGRRDEERRIIVGEAKRFVEGVEKGRKEEGMRRKRKKKEPDAVDDAKGPEDVKRTWRQFEVKGKERDGDSRSKKQKDGSLDEDVRAVLGKIF